MANGKETVICIKPFKTPTGRYAEYGESVVLHDLAARAKISSGHAVDPDNFKRRAPRASETPVDTDAKKRETKVDGPAEGEERSANEGGDPKERIRAALEEDNGNEMRRLLAELSDESIGRPDKPEIRARLEALLDD